MRLSELMGIMIIFIIPGLRLPIKFIGFLRSMVLIKRYDYMVISQNLQVITNRIEIHIPYFAN